MQCISCGKKLADDEKICPKCGKKQPLADTNNLTRFPGLKSLAPICLLIGLVIVPLGLTGIIFLIFLAIQKDLKLLEVILGLAYILLITALPFILALIFKNIK